MKATLKKDPAASEVNTRKRKRADAEGELAMELQRLRSVWPHDLHDAELRARRVLVAARSKQLPRIAAGAQYMIALRLAKYGEYARSIAALHIAIAGARRHDDAELASNAWNLFGLVNVWQGNYVEAIGCFQNSVSCAPPKMRALSLAQALTNTGLVYERREQWKQAHDVYHFAYKLQGDFGLIRPRILLNLASMKYELGAHKQSLRLTEQARREFAKTRQRVFESQALANAGFIWATLGEWDRGNALLEQAMALAREIGSVEQELNAQAQLAQVMIETEKWLDAKFAAAALYQQAERLNEPKYVREAHRLLAAVAEHNADWQAATQHFKALLALGGEENVYATHGALTDALNAFCDAAMGAPRSPTSVLPKVKTTSPPASNSSDAIGRNELALSARQREVLALICRGFTNPEIAKEIDVSVATSRFHVAEILAKLGASTRAQAAAIAMSRNLIALA